MYKCQYGTRPAARTNGCIRGLQKPDQPTIYLGGRLLKIFRA